jgi:serine/threonine protein kinase
MEGQILGNRYELIEKIGGGGMAVVYKARCKLLDRFVAVKILRPEFTNDEEFVKRFRIEAQSAASLSHPNIVSIYDVGHEGNIHYIVMEYIDGITLKEYISHEGFLKWKQAVNIAIQICSAIEQAHRNHIVHRDIKPHNILLTKDGIAKVTDFGIARAVSSSTITMVGSTIGSVHYFSPEQARGGFIDEKSDLYSLGIALYEMVTGKVPFDGDTPVAIALKHIQNQAKQPVEINKSIPKGVNDIIMRAIKKEQSQRYRTASDMLRDLYRVLKEPDGDFLVEDNTDGYPTRKIHALDEENFIQGEGQIEMHERDRKKGKKKDRYTVILAVLTSVIIMFAIGYITYKLVFPAIAPEQADFLIT